MNDWQPIETAPKTGRVDLWVKYWNAQTDTFSGRRIAGASWDHEDEYWSGVGQHERATHWMPEPEPPVQSMPP